ncbi:MAG: aminoglycoside phosphotransferase family protein [Clostridia bacterium]
MYNKIHRDHEYVNHLKAFICKNYCINAIAISPAKRGYYGETWRLEALNHTYFVKIDYFPRHQALFMNSLSIVDYLCHNHIDFIGSILKTCDGKLYSLYQSAVVGVFEWLDGESIETDDTKIPEYQMLCKIYPLTKPGFAIPTLAFSDRMAVRFYENLESVRKAPQTEAHATILALMEQQREKLAHRALRLSAFASICKENTDHFYFTHGDAGGNFFVGNGRNYIIDWDEVMYAPLERDAWVMCCRDWARELFNHTLMENNIAYELRSERLAFFCYHMFFLYLNEFLEDFMVHTTSDRIEDYLSDGWIEERIQFADNLSSFHTC